MRKKIRTAMTLAGLAIALIGFVILFVGVCRIPPMEPYQLRENQSPGKKNFFRHGVFTMRITSEENGIVTVGYRTAVDRSDRGEPQASQMVFYLPNAGEHGKLACEYDRGLRRFAEADRFTVCSLEYTGAALPERPDTLLKVQSFLTARLQLPRRRFFLIGCGEGAKAVLETCRRYPDNVAAAVCWNGLIPSHEPETFRADGPPVLCLTDHPERGAATAERFGKNGARPPVWCGVVSAPSGMIDHGISPEGWLVIHAFLIHVLNPEDGTFEREFARLPWHCAPGAERRK